MKLYFMIGLPTEDADDVRGIVQTGARARDVGRRVQRGRGPEVTVSVSTFVPKPHTPFQWAAMDPRSTVLEKQGILRDQARMTRVKLRMHDSEGSWLEGVLARGDRTLCEPIERAYLNGARFDCWEEHLKLDVWVEAFEHHGIDPARYLGTIPTTAKLPWDHIDVGLEQGFLAKEYRKAVKNRLSPPCGKAVGQFVHHTSVESHDDDKKKFVCYNCGVACDLTEMRDQRREYLVKLGALTKKVRPVAADSAAEVVLEPVSDGQDGPTAESGPVDIAVVPIEKKPEKVVPKNKRMPTASFDQGKPVRVRIGYEKLGRAAFRSHLDFVRLLPRMFRRLDLPIYYTQGFHPKPDMSFGPALPLGVASLAEYLDIRLIETPGLDEQAIRARLTGASLEDITFFDARVLGPNDAGVSRVIDTARYAVGLPASALETLGLADEAALKAQVEDKLAQKLTVVRDVKGIKRTIDVKQYLRSAHVGEGRELLTRAGVLGDLVPFTFEVHVAGQGGVRPSEVLEALLGTRELPTRVVRAFMGLSEGLTPIDLEPLRTRALSAAAEADASAEADNTAEEAALEPAE
jgi:radical SAM-linked protein